jgi:hypothetical protein
MTGRAPPARGDWRRGGGPRRCGAAPEGSLWIRGLFGHRQCSIRKAVLRAHRQCRGALGRAPRAARSARRGAARRAARAADWRQRKGGRRGGGRGGACERRRSKGGCPASGAQRIGSVGVAWGRGAGCRHDNGSGGLARRDPARGRRGATGGNELPRQKASAGAAWRAAGRRRGRAGRAVPQAQGGACGGGGCGRGFASTHKG